MKHVLWMLTIALLTLPCAAFASDPSMPLFWSQLFEQAVAQAPSDTVTRVGTVAGIASLLVMVLGQLLKSPLLKQLLVKVPSRGRVWVIVGLALVASTVGAWLHGMGWREAIAAAVTTMAGSIALHETLVASLLGKSTGDQAAEKPADAPGDQAAPKPPGSPA